MSLIALSVFMNFSGEVLLVFIGIRIFYNHTDMIFDQNSCRSLYKLAPKTRSTGENMVRYCKV